MWSSIQGLPSGQALGSVGPPPVGSDEKCLGGNPPQDDEASHDCFIAVGETTSFDLGSLGSQERGQLRPKIRDGVQLPVESGKS